MIERWQRLIAPYIDAAHQHVARSIVDDLVARYTAPDRHYHDLRHIESCLQLFDGVRSQASAPDAIEIAIWFHDAVYDSHRSDNEALSAQLAVEALTRLNVTAEVAAPVPGLIHATRHNAPPESPDAALLIDIDLAILGQPAPIFDAYEQGVRAEYTWVTEPNFRTGRSKVLQGFLNRPHIYATDYFRDKLEAAARENLNRSLAKLAG